MQFYSILFFLFVAVLFVLYYTVFRKKQWILLLAGSMLFYVWLASWRVLFLLVTSITIWGAAKLFDRLNDKRKQEQKREGITKEEKKAIKKKYIRKKRFVLVVILVINFGMLAAFKIWNLIPGPEGSLLHTSLILPLGISFYTFQAVSYLADVYNGKYQHEKNYFHFLLFVSWFPQIIQGPINRFNKLRDQFFCRHSIDWDTFCRMAALFLFGAFKKYAIADVLANTVQMIYDAPAGEQSGAVVVFGMLAFAMQEYADFSGGIDMAMAVSGLFGVQMLQNFEQPYFATSMANFWRRWHITLGAWMRDYVFYPLAVTKPMMNVMKWGVKKFGNTGRILPAAIGNVVVFLIVGIWHGTGWNYVFWGLYNGVLIAVSELLAPVFKRLAEKLHIDMKSGGFHVFQIIRTFILVCIGLLFEQYQRVADSFIALRCVFTRPDWDLSTVESIINKTLAKDVAFVPILVLIAIAIVFICSVMRERGTDVFLWIQNKNAAVRWGIWMLLIFLTIASFSYVQDVGGGFVYANF